MASLITLLIISFLHNPRHIYILRDYKYQNKIENKTLLFVLKNIGPWAASIILCA